MSNLHFFTFKLKRRDFKLKQREFKLKHRTSNFSTQSWNEITQVKSKHKILNLRQRGFKIWPNNFHLKRRYVCAHENISDSVLI